MWLSSFYAYYVSKSMHNLITFDLYFVHLLNTRPFYLMGGGRGEVTEMTPDLVKNHICFC